ncbi:MAG: hypothetical protein Unbinned2691contig1000_58 [Prokaryotic dsDNA virus sp.]|nr:MAG: hypothetical protein Unbinned2691contig1000_58 [Prokaryotic dsDNA virus sp.]|tara:strand:- start:12795 stop:13364 length:570 start_codon:yes stop_codon:yes gene_type:complete
MAKSFNARMQDRFATITASYEKANKYVHETAMMILKHAKDHKDCSTAQGLVMALPASMRREMLIMWFAKFSPIVVKNSDDWASKMHKEGTKLYVPFNLEEAEATPFYVLAEQNKERPPFDIKALLKMLEQGPKRLQKLLDDGEVPEYLSDAVMSVIEQQQKIKLPKIVEPANNNAPTPKKAAKTTKKAA